MHRNSKTRRIHVRRNAARASLVVACLLSFLLIVPKVLAQSEDQVMAAFLLNFARYVEWPQDAFVDGTTPVTICMLSSPEFGRVVSETISGKTVADRPVAINQSTDLAASDGCHIVFIARGFGSMNDVVAKLRGSSVFSVADLEGFASAGGVANFYREDNRIRFEINPKAAKKAGLKISSRLLRLAKVVN